MVKFQPSKLAMRVRFPLPAYYHPFSFICVGGFLTFAEPRYVFAYYVTSLHKCA
jgi:hypothetical protein